MLVPAGACDSVFLFAQVTVYDTNSGPVYNSKDIRDSVQLLEVSEITLFWLSLIHALCCVAFGHFKSDLCVQ